MKFTEARVEQRIIELPGRWVMGGHGTGLSRQPICPVFRARNLTNTFLFL